MLTRVDPEGRTFKESCALFLEADRCIRTTMHGRISDISVGPMTEAIDHLDVLFDHISTTWGVGSIPCNFADRYARAQIYLNGMDSEIERLGPDHPLLETCVAMRAQVERLSRFCLKGVRDTMSLGSL